MNVEAMKRSMRLGISNSELLIATADSDLPKIDDLLKNGADINFKDRHGNSALHWAVELGDVKTVQMLLSKGASIISKNDKAETPLDMSKRKNMQEIIDVLEPPKPPQPEVVLEQEPASNHSCAVERPINDPAPGDAHENKENMLERRKNAVHGNIYQLKLLMLFLYRGVSNKYSFRLGTEIQEAKKFDDLVFEYDVKGERVYRLLQAKHRLDESKTINAANLLKEHDGDFSLVKYFFSYLALKKDKLFSGGLVKDVTICTNIDFDLQNLERSGINVEKIEEPDEILDVKSTRKESARYKFSESIVDLLKPKLRSYVSPRFRKTDNYTDSDLKEFIRRLVFAVNQPNEDELGHIVKNEISREFDFITAENVYNKFFMSMLNWLQGKEKGIFLSYEDGKEFFVEINRGIQFWFGVKSPIESFTGRTELLNDLHKLMHAKDTKDEKSQFVCISGLGGVGKSELARKYVSEYSQDYDNKIVWINAESYETLADSFRRLACDQLKISTLNADNAEKKMVSIVEDVYAFFGDKKCLFIFDNAEMYKSQDEFDNGIQAFLPSLPDARNRLQVLITSRNQKWPKNINVLSLNAFVENEAIDFVKKSLNLQGDEQCEEVKKLVNELQLFPLALQQAVAYIGLQDEKLKNVGSQFKISNYLKKCKQKAREYLKFAEDNDSDYSKTTYSTWNVTIEAIRQREHGIEACEMLEILSYFAPADICVSTIKTLIKDETKLASAIDLLKQYSIINVVNTKLSIHRLVLKVMRLHLQEQKREQEILRKALYLFSAGTLTSENIEHAISVWSNSSSYCKLVDKFSSLPNDISRFLLDSWRFEEAELFGIKASRRIDALTSKNRETKLNLLILKTHTASALHRRAKYSLALKYCEEVYSVKKRMHGPKSFTALEAKSHMALMYTNMRQYERALELYDEVIEMSCKSTGVFDSVTLRTRLMKTSVLRYLGRYKEALDLLKELLPIHELLYGKNHSETLDVKSSISSVLSDLNEFDEANSILDQELGLDKGSHPNEHDPKNIIVRTNKALILAQQGKHKEALNLLQEVYACQIKFFGKEHPDSLRIRRSMGEAVRQLKRVDEALQIFLEVHKIQEKIRDPHIIATKERIGQTLIDRNNFTEGIRFYQDALKLRITKFGKEHSMTLRNMKCIATALREQGKFNEALKYAKEILESEEKIVGDDRVDVYATKHIIATILFYKGDFDEALKILREIIGIKRQMRDPDSLSTKRMIVEIMYKQGKYDEAIPICREMISAHEMAYGKKNDYSDFMLYRLSQLLYGAGKRSEYLKAVVELRKIADPTFFNQPGAEEIEEQFERLGMERAVALALVLKNDTQRLQDAINVGYDVNYADKNDSTLLHHAVKCSNGNIVEILLKNKADLSLVNVHGDTALHVAAMTGSLDAIKLLLKYGSIYNNRNKKGATPLDLCKSEGAKRFLTTVGELFEDAGKGNPCILKKLENMKSDELESIQEARNNDKKTLLQVIIMNKHVDLSHKVLKLVRSNKKL